LGTYTQHSSGQNRSTHSHYAETDFLHGKVVSEIDSTPKITSKSPIITAAVVPICSSDFWPVLFRIKTSNHFYYHKIIFITIIF